MCCEGWLEVGVMFVGGCCARLVWFRCIMGGGVGENIVEACCSVFFMVLVILLWVV